MNISEIAAQFMLGNIKPENLRQSCSSPNIKSEYSDLFVNITHCNTEIEIEEMFFSTLKEINIVIENKKVAAFIIINYYIKRIISKEVDPITGLEFIMSEVYKRVIDQYGDVKKFGDALSLQKLFGLYFSFDPLMKKRDDNHLEEKDKDVLKAIEEEMYNLAIEYNEKYLYAVE